MAFTQDAQGTYCLKLYVLWRRRGATRGVHPAPPWTEKQRADNSGFCSPCPTRQRRPEEVVQAAVKVGHTPAHGEHWLASWDLAAAHTSSVVRLEEEQQRVWCSWIPGSGVGKSSRAQVSLVRPIRGNSMSVVMKNNKLSTTSLTSRAVWLAERDVRGRRSLVFLSLRFSWAWIAWWPRFFVFSVIDSILGSWFS
jgi:hypothetical protein